MPDIAVPNRHARRAAGLRGPAFAHLAPSLPRFVRRNATTVLATEIPGKKTRRQRKARARAGRLLRARGLL